MTLIFATTIDAALLVAVDSAITPIDTDPIEGNKALYWSEAGTLLTGYGDFDQPPTSPPLRYESLKVAFIEVASHSERTRIAIDALNAEPNVHNQGGTQATCLLFGFERRKPVVSVLRSNEGAGSWHLAEPVDVSLMAGYLEPIEVVPKSGITSLDLRFSDASEFAQWCNSQMTIAAAWLQNHGGRKSIMPPAIVYVLEARHNE